MNTIAKEALFRRCADQCDTVEMMSRDMNLRSSKDFTERSKMQILRMSTRSGEKLTDT